MQNTTTAPIISPARVSIEDYALTTNNHAQVEALRALRTLTAYLDIHVTQATESVTIFEFFNHVHQEETELTVLNVGQVIARTIWEDVDGQARRTVTTGDVDDLTSSVDELFDELAAYQRRTFPDA